MIREHELIKDIKIIENFQADDRRGSFVKIYNDESYASDRIVMPIREIFYSVSQKNVIRGMHFQTPPHDHDKLVHVIAGRVVDVIVDLRKDSPTYHKCISIMLQGNTKQAVYIPSGFAHGFLSLEDNTVMMYMVSQGYAAECDMGIRWDSVGMQWNVENPIISDRDNHFVSMQEYESPFRL